MSGLVSIITPSYNSAKYIAETIQSVQNQTYTNWEMLIVDDCSSDNTEEIIKKIQQTDSRVHFFKLDQNSGPGVARNLCIQKASGNYIAFLDSDDKWKPEKLEMQLSFMKDNKIPLTFSFYEQIDERGNLLNKIVTTPKNISYKELFYCNWIGNLTGIYSVDFFGKIPILNIKKRQDWVLWLTLVKKIGKIKPIPVSLAYYRVREESVSSSKIKLLSHNFRIYKDYHEQNFILALFSMFVFLFVHFFIKPFFIKQLK